MNLDVEYDPVFVEDAGALLTAAVEGLTWDDRIRARRTASCGTAYNYSGLWYPDTTMPAFIAALADRVAHRVRHPITNCLANLYSSGESTMGFHSDSSEGIVPGSSTSIVSLGAVRDLTFRRKTLRSHTEKVRLESGSLLVMAAGVQDVWEHALLQTETTGVRVSLTFRHLAPRS